MPSSPSGEGGPDGPPGVPPGETEAKAKKSRVWRTEFIILFVWKEPTPSDALRSVTDEAPAAAGGGGAMMPTPPPAAPAPARGE
jgi:hypothetical protein